MATEKFSNNAVTTLNGAITNGATTLIVTSATLFPSTGQFRILIDSEIMIVTAVSGTTFTVLRGQEGTSAVLHANTAAVTQLLTRGALDQRQADMISSGAVGSLPASEKAGRIYLGNDYPVAFYDNGSVWKAFGPIYPLTPPKIADFTWRNQGSAIATDFGAGIAMEAIFNSGYNFRSLMQARAGTNYTVTLGMLPTFPLAGAGYANTGIQLYESGTGHMVCFSLELRIGSGLAGNPVNFLYIMAQQFTGDTVTGATDLYGAIWQIGAGGLVWLRVQSDTGSGHRAYYISADGVNWQLLFFETAGTFITEDQVGFYVNSFNSTANQLKNTILSWSNTTP